MTVDASEFKNALKRWASGVTVVTAQSAATGPRGMTATSFSSVSMEPPQILVCLNQATDTGQLLLAEQFFAVNVLTAEQQAVSNAFAGGLSQPERFDSVIWHNGEDGEPLLTQALVTLSCRLVNQVQAGSHWVVIGEVLRVDCRDAEPLLYYSGGYRQLAAL
jgi:flavin reductase (DIM6/NTAB) family NADH-FMN oxidoreductase RutF